MPVPSPAPASAPPRDYAQPGGATPEAAVALHRDLLRKADLETQMLADPADAALRAGYFDHLGRLAMAHTGLLTAMLPELGAPLLFRAATPDLSGLVGIFRDQMLAMAFRPTPRRILVIGAHIGLSAIDLARRHPHAEVLAVEPMADNYRLLTANTAAWPRIRTLRAAVWHTATRLAFGQRLQGDWTVQLTDLAEDGDRAVPALSVADVLAQAGWHHAEMVVVDASGAEREIFADPYAPWLGDVDVAVVRIHEALVPRARAHVEAALEPASFAHQRHGELDLFVRHAPRLELPPAPPPIRLLRDEPGLQRIGLSEVAASNFGFFVQDGHTCQLHPNPPGQPPARLIVPVHLAGHTRFSALVHHAGRPPAPPIRFSVLAADAGGLVVSHASVTAGPRETRLLTLKLPPLAGSAAIVLQTDMAEGAPNNVFAWARFQQPTLT